jgi:hypothetical protein
MLLTDLRGVPVGDVPAELEVWLAQRRMGRP